MSRIVKIGGKYRIITKIADSNYTKVYKVAADGNNLFALKLAGSNERIYNDLIAHEYSILANMAHPHIVRVYDFDLNSDGRLYFTMEYIKGTPMDKYFTCFSEEFVTATIQLLTALEALQSRGFIHNDLTPEHILYDAGLKRTVLLDFGFANVAGTQSPRCGTIGYVSPEIVKGSVANQRSDLYSLGVIMYEVISGKRMDGVLTPLADVPEEINRMLGRLVSTEPALRPTIPELYQVLKKYAPSAEIELLSYDVRLPSTGFVENKGIIEQIRQKTGECIVILGDTGLGKTRLLQELKYRCLMDGCDVLHHQATEGTSLLEILRSRWHAGEEMSEAEDKYQIFEEITQSLIKVATKSKLVIAIDDIDELSDYDLSLFRYIGYGVKESKVLVVGTAKSTDKARELGFAIQILQPLTEADTAQLTEKTFPELTSVGDAGIERFTSWLHKQTGGNPLFIVEVLKILYDKEILCYRDGRWHLTADRLDEVLIPQKFIDLLAPRIAGLAPGEARILKILAVADHPLQPAVVNKITDDDFDVQIESLKRIGLIREDAMAGQRTVMVANKMIIDYISKETSDEESLSLCKGLIKAIETTTADEKLYVQLLADLYEATGNADGACTYLKLAAEGAEEIYDYQKALRYYERITKYKKHIDAKDFATLLTTLGDINQILGDNAAATVYYNDALKCDGADIEAKANAGLGKIALAMGRHDDAISYFQRGLINPEDNAREHVKTANQLGYVCIQAARFADAEKIFLESLKIAREAQDHEAEADTLYYLASLEWYRGDFVQGIQQAEVLNDFCRKNKLLKLYAYSTGLLGSFYQQQKNFEMAQNYLNMAVRTFQDTNRAIGIASSLDNQASLFFQQGKFKDAYVSYTKALEIGQKIDNKLIYLVSLANLAMLNTIFGRFGEAISQYDEILAIDPAYVWAIYGKAMLLLIKGGLEEAGEVLGTGDRDDALLDIGRAALSVAAGDHSESTAFLSRAVTAIETGTPLISVQTEICLKAGCLYFELGDYDASLRLTEKLLALTFEGSREHSIGQAIEKLAHYVRSEGSIVDIGPETARLKEIGCIYDYAYLKRLWVESVVSKGLGAGDVRNVIEELRSAQEVFESLGADLELSRVNKLQSRLFPLIVDDYSRRYISDQYLQTFAGIAELISSDLGDEHFVQNILDLVIKATNAERGALFVQSTKGMEFVAGRNIDQTTIKDASELSHTAIKSLEKGKILFAQDALSDPTFNIKKSVMLNQIRSLLCIPLSVAGNIIGAIYLDSRIDRGIFGPQDKDFLLTISKILASVIEKSMAFQSMSEENILLKSNIIKEIGGGHLIGRSRVMKEVYHLIDSVAETNSPVLILGETGTGKGMIARLIHLRSQRKTKNFLSINCGTIPETLLESELFGHKKGAFTGAISDKKGLLEEGEGGTVFLDEITNTSLEFQGKLLEAIEDKVIRRVGETTTRNIDVRFLFATNKDLEIEVEDSRFRRDLFYRINVFKIEMPPLRDRANDIPLLAQFFLDRYTKEINKKIDGFAPEAMQRLIGYLWPGNVRELQNVIERAVVLAKGKLINLRDIGFERTKTAEVIPLKEIKKEAVIEALNLANWNITKAAKSLNIGRRSLHRYIKKFDIVNDGIVSIGTDQS